MKIINVPTRNLVESTISINKNLILSKNQEKPSGGVMLFIMVVDSEPRDLVLIDPLQQASEE